MEPDEKIQAHLVSIWRESKKFFAVGGREGMLILTDKHLMFVHKTEAKKKWWGAIRQRQTVHFLKSKDTMIIHDGYNENILKEDLENEKNVELRFDDILNITHEEKDWGSILLIDYEKNGKHEKHQYSVAQDWVKYPAKEPTKYMHVEWEPFVHYIKKRQKITR